MKSGWLSVSDNIGVQQMVPRLGDFGFTLTPIQAQFFQNARHQRAYCLAA